MKFAAVLTVLSLGLFVGMTGTKTASSQETTGTISEPTPDPAPACTANMQRNLKKAIRFYRAATWEWQDRMFLKHVRRPYSDGYVTDCSRLNEIAHWWVSRAERAKKAFKKFQKTFAYQVVLADRDFNRALTLASGIFNVSRSWLWNCAKSEGGTGEFVMNRQGSGAGGWMQFMSGTFYGYVGAAFSAARAKGYFIPSRFASWYSRVGQAVTAAYMFSTGQSGHWVGAGC